MEGPLEDIIYVDAIIFTEVTRQATSRASSNATYYAIYFSQPDYWLPIEKTVYLPADGQAFQETTELKDALKPLSELSFACFPNCNSQQPSLRIYLIFQDTATAETASDLLTTDSGALSPGELSETGPDILGPQGLREHLANLQPLAHVPVFISVVDKQLILRIGSNDPSRYHKDFRWFLNTDVYYDPECLDRMNEVSVLLDPDCTHKPLTSGSERVTGSWEIDSVADMISDGIFMLNQDDTDLAITFAFHRGRSTEQLRSQLRVVNELDIANVNEAHSNGRTDEYRPESSSRYKPGLGRESNERNRYGSGGGEKKPPHRAEDSLAAEGPKGEASVKGSGEKNEAELYPPKIPGLGSSDKSDGGDLDITDRRSRGQEQRGSEHQTSMSRGWQYRTNDSEGITESPHTSHRSSRGDRTTPEDTSPSARDRKLRKLR